MKVPANIVKLNISKECVALMIVLKQKELFIEYKNSVDYYVN